MSASGRRNVGGVLLLYHRPVLPWEFTYADNVTENIAAFQDHSRFPIWSYNVAHGFRPRLESLRFAAIVLHYSVFIPRPNYMLGEELIGYLESSDSYKVAFFQDEHHYCGMRFDFINRVGIDCVYTMLEQPYADQVYGTRTRATKIVSHFPSYVGAALLDGAAKHAKPDAEREIDIGYRGRPMPAYMGRGAQEKAKIGDRFAELARDSGLVLDIATSEEDRIYAGDWHVFTGNSKGTLGTESGVSCFDLEDEVRSEYERLSAAGHVPTVEELDRGALGRWDGRIPYRTASPRNFEAAAFRTCQILYEGHYSGVMQPMRHYIPLRKDFSNIEEVVERFKQPEVRAELTENAHRDLIASGAYGYEHLITKFDEGLVDAGVEPAAGGGDDRAARRALRRSARERWRQWEQPRLAYLWVHHRRRWFLALLVLHPIKAAAIVGSKLLQRLGIRPA